MSRYTIEYSRERGPQGASGSTDASAITSGTLNAARLPATVVQTTGTYANPAWITELASTKITGTLAKSQQHAQTAYLDATSQVFAGAATFNGLLQINGAAGGASTYLQLLNNSGAIGILGSDASISGGNAADVGLSVYGDNEFCLWTNSTRMIRVNDSGSIFNGAATFNGNTRVNGNHLVKGDLDLYDTVQDGASWWKFSQVGVAAGGLQLYSQNTGRGVVFQPLGGMDIDSGTSNAVALRVKEVGETKFVVTSGGNVTAQAATFNGIIYANYVGANIRIKADGGNLDGALVADGAGNLFLGDFASLTRGWRINPDGTMATLGTGATTFNGSVTATSLALTNGSNKTLSSYRDGSFAGFYTGASASAEAAWYMSSDVHYFTIGGSTRLDIGASDSRFTGSLTVTGLLNVGNVNNRLFQDSGNLYIESDGTILFRDTSSSVSLMALTNDGRLFLKTNVWHPDSDGNARLRYNGSGGATNFYGVYDFVSSDRGHGMYADGSIRWGSNAVSGNSRGQLSWNTDVAILTAPLNLDLGCGGLMRYIATSHEFNSIAKLGDYTVATLPSAASNAGYECNVTDSSVTTFGSTVAGGGSNNVKVRSNGTNWTVTGI